ncbi:MAG: DUF998 domain-containing protein [Calditrichaeota bacterium]|nr:DUF998 domain-containing protein [Calditrichota bacterium]
MRVQIIAFTIVYLLMLLTIFILPFYSVETYSIMRNTTSELAAQQTINAWIMRTIFVLLALASIWAGWIYLERFWFQRICLLCFGISLLMTAVYSHAPIDRNLAYNISEDEWQSLFASITGFLFTLLAVSIAFIHKQRFAVYLSLLIAFVATLLSLLMFSVIEFSGIWQRLIFILSFGWLIYEFNKEGIYHGQTE